MIAAITFELVVEEAVVGILVLLCDGWEVALEISVGIFVPTMVGEEVGVKFTITSSSSISNVIRKVGESVTKPVLVVDGAKVGFAVGVKVGMAVGEAVGSEGEGPVMPVGCRVVGTELELVVESAFGSPPSSCRCSSSISEGDTQ